MVLFSLRRVTVALCAAGAILFAQAAGAQSGDPKTAEQQRQQAAQDKDGQKPDDFADAARLIAGPAGNPECVWLGRRVVSLLSRDDMDTAFRHLDLYDRFGCPGQHIQMTFRCLVRQGSNVDQKAAETLNSRVHACWLNPGLPPSAAAAASGPAAAPAAPAGNR
jgi:hypothetical protein